jgi:hypothetical protein
VGIWAKDLLKVEEFPCWVEHSKIILEGDVLPKSNTKERLEKTIRGGEMTMENNERNDVFLQAVATILLRSFLFGLAFLLLWFLLYSIAAGWMFEMSARWFNIGKRDFDLINYFGIGFVKISILLFFFLPYLAIRTMSRKKERKRPT